MAKSFKSLVKKTSTAKSKKIAKKRTKSLLVIEQEIEWYKIRKPIAEAMRTLGHYGFECAGHGVGFGGEDFSLINENKNCYVNFCDKGRSCEVTISKCDFPLDNDGLPVFLFKGTICKALKFLEKV